VVETVVRGSRLPGAYGDTDSLFVGSGTQDQDVTQQGMQLADSLNEQLSSYIRERWGVRSRLELEYEKPICG